MNSQFRDDDGVVEELDLRERVFWGRVKGQDFWGLRKFYKIFEGEFVRKVKVFWKEFLRKNIAKIFEGEFVRKVKEFLKKNIVKIFERRIW